MKATLEFELPKEQAEFKHAANAENLWLALWDIQKYLRTQHKYHDPEENLPDNPLGVYETFHEICADRGVDLD